MGETKEIERSVQMRLYVLQKRQFMGVFALFFTCLLLMTFIRMSGPSTIQTTAYKPVDELQSSLGPLKIQSEYLDKFHQRLWLTMESKTNTQEEFRQKINVTMSLQHLSSSVNPQIYESQRTVHCQKQTCNQIILFHLNFLHDNIYYFEIQLNGLNEKVDSQINSIQFFLNTFNPSYTQLELGLRFFFLLGSIVVACLFTKSMRQFSILDWSLEQRWMIFLLVLLIFFNDPFYPTTFLTDHSLPSVLDGILHSTFICTLLLFWLSIYHGFRQIVRRFLPFYLPKIVLVGFIWILSVVLSSIRIIQEFRDPMYNMIIDIRQFTSLRVIFYLVCIVYILYLSFLIIRAFGELHHIPYFDVRVKFTTGLMVTVVGICFMIVILRFGTDIMEENFVPEFASRSKSSAEFLSIISLMNFYLFAMSYVYSPAKNAAVDSLFRDNPTFSMINDSDEDVVYGSEHEISRLTSVQE